MAYYVPLGPRGVLFHLGLVIIKVVGGAIYWRASRKRAFMPLPVHDLIILPEA